LLAVSLTPSLLPRTWIVQGLISGVSTAAGYAIGMVSVSDPRCSGWRWPRCSC
jgi:uncharacterized membrane protein